MSAQQAGRSLFVFSQVRTRRCCSMAMLAILSLMLQSAVVSAGDKAGASATEWPAFRGAQGMGASTATGLPVKWDSTSGIVWKTPLSGAGASSPIVFGDRIYLTNYTGFFVPGESGGSQENLKRHLLAINRADGRLIWDQAVAAKLPEEEQIRDHGFAASTPAADADHVYVFFGKTGVIAFDHDGRQVWQADVGSRTDRWGSSASPVLYKDLVFINASVEKQTLFALDRRTGKEVWHADGIVESWNTPVLVTSKSGDSELVVATKGSVRSYQPATGKLLWTCQTDIGWYMVPSVVAHDGIVYCLGGRSGVAGLAVRTGGSGDVTETHRLWTSVKGSNVSSPVFLNDHLFWMHEQRGVAYCAKAATGDVIYEQRLDRAGQVYSSALLADGRLYYLTREGRTYVLDASPTFKQLASNDLNDGSVFNGTPAVDGARLLIRSDRFLYCIGQ